HVVENRAGLRGDESDRHAEDEPDRGRRRREREHGAAAPEKAAQDISAQVVGPELRGAGWRRVGRRDELVRRVRREDGADDGDPDEEHHGDETDLRPALTPRRPEEDRPGLPPGDGGRGDGKGPAHGSDVLRRGVTRIVAMSASRLSTTYRPAISMASAWTTGMARLATASTSAAPMPAYPNTNSTTTIPPAR